jgi:hypothetical protein
MTAAHQLDQILDQIVTQLGDIDVASTHYGGGSYSTGDTANDQAWTVRRGLLMPNQVDETDRPLICVGCVEPVNVEWRPGGRSWHTVKIAVHAYIPRKNTNGTAKTQNQIDEYSQDARGDITLAIAEDIRLGGKCVSCLPRDLDASEGRPPDADDAWCGVMLDTRWYGSRSSQ